MKNKDIMYTPPLEEVRIYGNKLIQQSKCSNFKEFHEITLENLRLFLQEMLKAYSKKNICENGFLDILDFLGTYIHWRYMDDYPETLYPNLPDSDPRSIGVDAINYINDSIWSEHLLPPEMIEEFLVFLQTPLGKEMEGHQRIRDYLIAKGVLSKEHLNL